MRIAFDLDNLLIPYSDEFPVEELTRLNRFMGIERLRLGAKDLINDLSGQGHEIWIYTTSLRSPRKIQKTFRAYGIRLHGVVNRSRHEKVLGSGKNEFSKFPPAFDIDLLIDDSKGVEIEGKRGNFRTIRIDPDTVDWIERIKGKIADYNTK